MLKITSLRHLLCSATICAMLGFSQPGLAAPDAATRQLIDQGKHHEALALVQKQPHTLENRFLQAWLLQQLGQADQAIAAYQALIADQPSMPEPYNNLAVLYAARGEHGKARDALLSAINTHPSYATAYENLGNIYAKMAVSAYNRALDTGKQEHPGPVQLASIDNLTGNSRTEPRPATTAISVAAMTAPAVEAPPSKEPPAPVSVTNPPAVDPAQTHRDIIDTVVGWSAAWSAQDVDGYLAYYAQGFVPGDGLSRSNWAAQRRQRLRAPRFIKITIEAPQVELVDATTAVIRFKQNYQSDRFNDVSQKNLGLKKIDGQWQILSEQSNG